MQRDTVCCSVQLSVTVRLKQWAKVTSFSPVGSRSEHPIGWPQARRTLWDSLTHSHLTHIHSKISQGKYTALKDVFEFYKTYEIRQAMGMTDVRGCQVPPRLAHQPANEHCFQHLLCDRLCKVVVGTLP